MENNEKVIKYKNLLFSIDKNTKILHVSNDTDTISTSIHIDTLFKFFKNAEMYGKNIVGMKIDKKKGTVTVTGRYKNNDVSIIATIDDNLDINDWKLVEPLNEKAMILSETDRKRIKSKEAYERLFRGCESSHDRFVASIYKISCALNKVGYSEFEIDHLLESIKNDLR